MRAKCKADAKAFYYAVDIFGKFDKVQDHAIAEKKAYNKNCQIKLLRGDVSMARGTRSRRTCALHSYEGHYWGNNNQKSGVCPPGSYAYGFQQLVEPRQRGGDDTALNGIRINCRNMSGPRRGGVVEVDTGHNWGRPGSWAYCPTGMWITGYRMKVEPYQDSGQTNDWALLLTGDFANEDDTGTNAIQFRCRNHDWSRKVDISTNNDGPWGNWGPWHEAQSGLFVVAIHAHTEKSQGRGDDTAMNQIWFSVARKP